MVRGDGSGFGDLKGFGNPWVAATLGVLVRGGDPSACSDSTGCGDLMGFGDPMICGAYPPHVRRDRVDASVV